MDLPTSRIRFREAALNFWAALHEKDVDRANEETAKGEQLLGDCAEQGRACEFLEPLLKDADPEVRFAAASLLLPHGGEDVALPVLEELKSHPSMVGPTAWLRLKTWKRDAQ